MSNGWRVIREAGHRAMPWKNGGGTTAEIAVWPEGAGVDDFDWRLSMATVAADGPFSMFPGVDRALAVLDGEGIQLSVDGVPPVTLRPDTAPHAFPADRPARATLLGGSIRDLNVMVRRDFGGYAVRRIGPDEAVRAAAGALHLLVFCVSGTIVLDAGGAVETLGRHDAAHAVSPGFSPVITVAPGATGVLVEIVPAAGRDVVR